MRVTLTIALLLSSPALAQEAAEPDTDTDTDADTEESGHKHITSSIP